MAGRGLAAHKKRALDAGATLIFVDESGFSLSPSLRRTWAPEGETPVITEHFNWKRMSAIGAVAWRPGQPTTRLFLTLHPGNIDSSRSVDFLRNIRRHVRGPVVLVWDRLPAHRSRETLGHVQEQSTWLTVEYLPAYAPELNPVEPLWSSLKGKHAANYPADMIDELDAHLRRSIRRVRRCSDIGLGFIKHAQLMSDEEYMLLCKGQ